MSAEHWVRVGSFGEVGRFRSVDAVRYPRGSRVVVRTRRGLEVGQVLSAAAAGGDAGPATSMSTDNSPTDNSPAGSPDGLLVRRTTAEDELLVERLERDKQRALADCQRLLDERGVGTTVLDAEVLLDGGAVCFRFLGPLPPHDVSLEEELAAIYDARVQWRRFADLLAEGCGPDCGAKEACEPDGRGGCASCAVAQACRR